MNVLVDSSVWIDHLRKSNKTLISLLEEDRVLMHPNIIGELACGTLKNRYEFLSLLDKMPCSQVATLSECFNLLERRHLYGKGIGWIDLNLLTSTLISSSKLFTLDKSLLQVAAVCRVDFQI